MVSRDSTKMNFYDHENVCSGCIKKNKITIVLLLYVCIVHGNGCGECRQNQSQMLCFAIWPLCIAHWRECVQLYIFRFWSQLNGIIGDCMIAGRVSACRYEWMDGTEKKNGREINYATHKIYHNDKWLHRDKNGTNIGDCNSYSVVWNIFRVWQVFR